MFNTKLIYLFYKDFLKIIYFLLVFSRKNFGYFPILYKILLKFGALLDIFIISFLIFLARVVDVTFGTLRMITIVRDEKIKAFFLSFFEVLIWTFASAQVITNLTNPYYIVGYCFGYATGVYVGMVIENKLSTTERIIQLFTYREKEIHSVFSNVDFKIFEIAQIVDEADNITIFYLKTVRKNVRKTLTIFKAIDPKGYYIVHEVRLNQKRKFRLFPSFLKRK